MKRWTDTKPWNDRAGVAAALAVATFVAAVAGAGSVARADAPGGAAAPTGKYADAARQDRGNASYIRQEIGDIAEALRAYDGIVKDDLAKAKDVFEAEAVLRDKAADAWDADDEPRGRQLREEAEKAVPIRALWRQRLYEWRKRQGEAAPDEKTFRDAMSWTKPGAVPQMFDLVRARRAASEAWGRLAEATVPGADPTALDDLKERAYAADAEREIAELKATWVRQREQTWGEKKVTSDALVKRAEELDKLENERVELRRAEISHDRQVRSAEARLKAAETAFRLAYEAAAKETHEREARERAAGKK